MRSTLWRKGDYCRTAARSATSNACQIGSVRWFMASDVRVKGRPLDLVELFLPKGETQMIEFVRL